MRAYAQYCPIAKTAEIIGDRWSILILRDMLVGSTHFNDLARGLPGISRDLLSRRLRHLAAAGLIARTANGYELTAAGLDLHPVVFSMAEWGARWAFPEPELEDLDPDLLIWWMHGRMEQDVRQGAQVVVEIQFTDSQAHYWLVVESDDVSVCVTDPGLEVDVVLNTSLRTLYFVWMGRRELTAALRDGSIELSGDPTLVRAFPGWLQLSPVSPAVRASVG